MVALVWLYIRTDYALLNMLSEVCEGKNKTNAKEKKTATCGKKRQPLKLCAKTKNKTAT